jgi:hypothetical protein
MKKLMITLIIFALGLGAAAAQDGEQSRDLYLARVKDQKQGRPGARVRIELLRDGRRTFVPADTVFRAGDKVKFHFAVNFPAYVVVMNMGSTGRWQLLFPYRGSGQLVAATRDYEIPNDDSLWFEFDDHPGEERLNFIFSHTPIGPSRQLVAGDPTQNELESLNQQALGEGRDLKLARVGSGESYVTTTDQRLRRPSGFTIRLRHW